MTTGAAAYTVRKGDPNDALKIVELLSEEGNPNEWSYSKWGHYYRDYTEGTPISIVVEVSGNIVGHYGLFPVKIGESQVYLGAHAHVSKNVRGLVIVSKLMKFIDDYCVANEIPFIVGFANERFTEVKSRLFKWKVVLWASFVQLEEFDPARYENRPLKFAYSDKWLAWRFGLSSEPVLSKYLRGDDRVSFQLLHSKSKVNAKAFDVSLFECWQPEGYSSQKNTEISQPFSIKIYQKYWSGPDLLNVNNWQVQMGDSDTFIYKEPVT